MTHQPLAGQDWRGQLVASHALAGDALVGQLGAGQGVGRSVAVGAVVEVLAAIAAGQAGRLPICGQPPQHHFAVR
jgi:hypothetical protein